jgi:uncharacterized membrane protein
MNKFRQLWDRLRSGFWFLPSLMVGFSIAFASILIEADTVGVNQWLRQWPRLFGAEAEGARQMLSTLAGSMMTIMGVTFSMTLLALVLASGQYTSRILRNFMRSRVTQVTLGVFASIFAYCLIVLRTIRGSAGAEEFVPSLAVFFALLMSLVGVVVLIYFIHHIASSIQASSIIASVADETNASIDRILPKKTDVEREQADGPSELLEALDNRIWYPVPAATSGYVQSVNIDTLLRLAEVNKTIVRMEQGIGDFVVQDTTLVSLALTYPPDQKVVNALNAAYSISRHRTVEQDPAFGISQIVDMAMKALSPGVNDTSTAVMCVDYLSSIMARLTDRQFPLLHRYEGEALRLVAISPGFEELLADAFDQIRVNAEVNVAILVRILGALDTIGSLTKKHSHIEALNEQLQRMSELVDRCIKCKHDHKRLKSLLSSVRETLKAQTALATLEDSA